MRYHVSMIALGGPKLKLRSSPESVCTWAVSMIALGGPKLKHGIELSWRDTGGVSMIALGGPKLKLYNSCSAGCDYKFQ